MTNSTNHLIDGYNKAFIDSNVNALPQYSPQFITNTNGEKVLTCLERELRECSDLYMSVAFITMSGLSTILGPLDELRKRGVKGRIITTDYLTFSEPKALDKLNQFENLELRIYKSHGSDTGFHTKGYMFHNANDLRIIIGSSNLTANAITKNHEWNTKIVSSLDGQYAKDVESEFDSIWEQSVCYNEYKDEYSKLYYDFKSARTEYNKLAYTLNLNYSQVLQPNAMQEDFINNIKAIIKKGGTKALLVSATGTGKTYASAFAIREIYSESIIKKSKTLFISHREQINKQALKSYKRIFGNKIPMDLISGNHNDIETARQSQFIFATMNMMAKDDIMQKFNPEEFSVIVLDECHRTGAQSYQKIIRYFKPKLLLGMSASPERTDGFDVFEQFDHNIACEVRLQQALEHNLLCPFHYFGIADIEIDGDIDDEASFDKLTSDARVNHIIDRAEYFGYSGERVKGLIFCSNKKEALELSSKFNATGKYKTTMLCGDNSQEERELAIERLVNGKGDNRFDYIFTVDIFNEGVDIPEINQVIMLRPTESPIIFVQQLGRGLRKAADKEFVIVIDFIGNYKNNYMIPIALTGDRTGNKDNIRRGLVEGNNIIKGVSTIYFDEISRKKIYSAIDSAKLNQKKQLIEAYRVVKMKLGRIPSLLDFDKLGEIDPLRFTEYKNFKSYHSFLSQVEEDYKIVFTEEQNNILEYVFKKLAPGKRVYELFYLKYMLQDHKDTASWEEALFNKYNIRLEDTVKTSMIKVLHGQFFRNTVEILNMVNVSDKGLQLSDSFKALLSNVDFKNTLLETIDFGLERFEKQYSDRYSGTDFCLNKKYTYSDVCWLLNWDKEEVAQNIGGYKFDRFSNTYPIFINYNKADDISHTINYEDRFVNQSTLIAISKSKRSAQSPDVTTAVNAVANNVLMPLFVRKNKDDNTSKEFYFLGSIKHNGYLREFIMPKTKNVTAVEIGYTLNTAVNNNLYEYITK